MKFDQDSVPSTVDEAVQKVVQGLTDEDREVIRATNLADVHFGLGISLRNAWSLWERDSPLKRDAAERFGIAHPDDISGLIVGWVYAIVRGEPFDPAATCAQYHEHWKRYGTDSLSAGGWPPKE